MTTKDFDEIIEVTVKAYLRFTEAENGTHGVDINALFNQIVTCWTANHTPPRGHSGSTV
jgi:hypothetical protein